MAINRFGTEYLLEIQNGEKSDGILCCERILVGVHDEGAGVFLSLKTDNLEPEEDYDNHTVTVTKADLFGLTAALGGIFKEYEEVS